jgi:hypothetical protein
MAFSGSSYFAGIGTAFAAVAVGFAGGAMVTTTAVQPPNRLERVAAGTAVPSDSAPASTAPSSPEQANTAKPVPQEATPSPVIAAAPSPPAADPKPAPQLTDPAAAKTDAAASVQQQPAPAPVAKNNPAPASTAKGEDAAPAKNERAANARSADPNRETSRRRADDRKPDDRKFSDRRRRPDQDERRLDEATNVIRQMPRGGAVDEIVERNDAPRFRMRPRHFELYGDDDAPGAFNEPPPRIGFFGDN